MSAFAVSTSIATNSILDPLRQPHPRCTHSPHPVGASLSSFVPRAGLVALRQRFVHRCHAVLAKEMLGDGSHGMRMRGSVLPAPWRGCAPASRLAATNKCLAQSNKTRTRAETTKKRDVAATYRAVV